MFIDGYADLRTEDYYVVPSAQYTYDTIHKRPVIYKVPDERSMPVLRQDGEAFMKIISRITKEYLVYLLVTEIHKNFMNTDGSLSNQVILGVAEDIWKHRDNLRIQPVKKKFIIDKDYWLSQGISDWLEVTRIIQKKIRHNDLDSAYDHSKTLEENLKELKNFGISIKRKAVIEWLDENGYSYTTDKDYKEMVVLFLYEEDKTRSCKDLEKLCRKEGVSLHYKTICKIIRENIR